MSNIIWTVIIIGLQALLALFVLSFVLGVVVDAIVTMREHPPHRNFWW